MLLQYFALDKVNIPKNPNSCDWTVESRIRCVVSIVDDGQDLRLIAFNAGNLEGFEKLNANTNPASVFFDRGFDIKPVASSLAKPVFAS